MSPRELKEFLLKGHKSFLQHLSIDRVIFGFHDNQLKVLLLKWKDFGGWSVPGGFVKRIESIDDSPTYFEGTDWPTTNFFTSIPDIWRSKPGKRKEAIQNTWDFKKLVHGQVCYHRLLGTG